MGLFNLKDQFSFYGAYHNDKRNVWVHIVFVPAITWSFWVLLATLGPMGFVDPNHFLVRQLTRLGLEPNYALLNLLVYFAYYLVLDPTAALLYLPILLTMYLTATSLAHSMDLPQVLAVGVGVHVISWLAQFYSHAKFEGRAPALLDNVAQALLMAPFFVFLEVLFMFGYREAFQREIQVIVRQKIREFRANQTRVPKKPA
ncbi:hypothetical protein H4R33_005753 [Dimargaris cristalligena]|nr:hypothetical protein H4R33_005753 [Dimargaris cristalligena]